ncbi:MAG: hypothetical protein J6Y94_06940, partial [Bacteriovoracaceae bacterium]|nr:hypothetical protein [Bacteriovoracaceae bacterium]
EVRVQIVRPSRSFQLIIFSCLTLAIFFYCQNFTSFYFGQADYFTHHFPLTNHNFGEMEVYDYHILGGTLVRPFYGYIPLEMVLNFFIPDRILAMSFLGMIIAILNGLWGMATIENFSNKKFDPFLKFCLFLIFCFFPHFILRWRAGHGNFLWGMNFFFLNLWVVSKIHQTKLREITLEIKEKIIIVAVFAAVSFNFVAQFPHVAQIAFYDLLFLAPLYLYYFWRFSTCRSLIISIILVLGLIGVIHFDQLFLALTTAWGQEYVRLVQNLVGNEFDWSNAYLPHLFNHHLWITYIAHSPLNKIIGVSELGFLHEHFYVFSLLVIPAFCLAWPKYKILPIAYLGGLVAAFILFGGLVPPGVEDNTWINHIPLWHYFRCPALILMLFSILSYVIGVYFLINLGTNKSLHVPFKSTICTSPIADGQLSLSSQIILFLLLFSVFWLPIRSSNFFAFLGLLAFILVILCKFFASILKRFTFPAWCTAIINQEKLIVLALAFTAISNILSFRSGTYVSPLTWQAYQTIQENIDQEVVPQIEPGDKVVFLQRQSFLGSNNEAIYGLDTLHGYSTPLKRFTDLWITLINHPEKRGIINLLPHEPDQTFKMLYQSVIGLFYDGRWAVQHWLDVAAVRSPRHLHIFSSLEELAAAQTTNYRLDDPHFWQQNVMLLKEDLAQHALTFLTKTVLKSCPANLSRTKANLAHGEQLQVNLNKNAEFPCLLVLPYNYSKFLKTDTPAAAIFPADYSLIGLYLHQAPPQHQFKILTKLDFRRYIFAKVGIWFILIVLGGGYYLLHSKRQSAGT